VTNGCDFRQINGMLPLRAVVGLDMWLMMQGALMLVGCRWQIALIL